MQLRKASHLRGADAAMDARVAILRVSQGGIDLIVFAKREKQTRRSGIDLSCSASIDCPPWCCGESFKSLPLLRLSSGWFEAAEATFRPDARQANLAAREHARRRAHERVISIAPSTRATGASA